MQTHHLDELKSNEYLLRNFSQMSHDEMASSLNTLHIQLKASEAAADGHANDKSRGLGLQTSKEKEEQ